MGEPPWLKTGHCAFFHVSHSFQANGMFRVGTVGGREHIACRQLLAHLWTTLGQYKSEQGKINFTVKDGEEGNYSRMGGDHK